MKSFLIRWLFTSIAVAIAARVVPGINYDTTVGLLLASLFLGILNAFVRPVMLLLALPLLIFSLGLFVIVINAFLLYWVGHMKTFHVASFGAAIWGSLIISIVTMVLNAITGKNGARIEFRTNKSSPSQKPPDDGGGPVIDV